MRRLTFATISSLTLALILGFSTLFLSSQPTQAATRYVYLGQYEWDTSIPGMPSWECPLSCLGTLDMRSTPQRSTPGPAPLGYAIFQYDKVVSLPGFTLLGTSLDSQLTLSNKAKLETRLNLIEGLGANRLGSALWELMTYHADPTGLARWKPLMPSPDGQMELYFGDFGLIKGERFRFPENKEADSRIHQNVLEVYKADYRRIKSSADATEQLLVDEGLLAIGDDYSTIVTKIKAAVETCKSLDWAPAQCQQLRLILKRIPPRHHLKVLKSLVLRHNIAYTRFIPSGLPSEEPLPVSTFLSDNFPGGDNGLGANWTDDVGTWNTISNTATATTTGCNCITRYTGAALSTDDHWAEVAITTSANWAEGPVIRKVDSATEDYYATIWIPSSGVLRMIQFLAGSSTTLGSDDSITHNNGDRYKISVIGTTLKHYQNDVQIGATRTDSGISGNLRAGMVMNPQTTLVPRLDNWEASDIVAGAGVAGVGVIWVNVLYWETVKAGAFR